MARESTSLRSMANRLRTAATHEDLVEALVWLLEGLASDQESHAATLRACVRGTERDLNEQRRVLAEFEAAIHEQPARVHG